MTTASANRHQLPLTSGGAEEENRSRDPHARETGAPAGESESRSPTHTAEFPSCPQRGPGSSRRRLDAHAILDAILFEFNQIATARQPRSPELCPPSAPVLPPIAPIAPASAAAASSQYIDIDLLHLYSSRHKDGRRHAMASYPTPSTYALN